MIGGGTIDITYSPNGDFKNHVNFPDGKDATEGGKYEIKGGFLIETVTNVSPPLVMRYQIIQSAERFRLLPILAGGIARCLSHVCPLLDVPF